MTPIGSQIASLVIELDQQLQSGQDQPSSIMRTINKRNTKNFSTQLCIPNLVFWWVELRVFVFSGHSTKNLFRLIHLSRTNSFLVTCETFKWFRLCGDVMTLHFGAVGWDREEKKLILPDALRRLRHSILIEFPSSHGRAGLISNVNLNSEARLLFNQLHCQDPTLMQRETQPSKRISAEKSVHLIWFSYRSDITPRLSPTHHSRFLQITFLGNFPNGSNKWIFQNTTIVVTSLGNDRTQ